MTLGDLHLQLGHEQVSHKRRELNLELLRLPISIKCFFYGYIYPSNVTALRMKANNSQLSRRFEIEIKTVEWMN